ncbi:MAG: hypothetical protein KFF73_09035 [Cyclobacteriaceae bacterium]|nr:hypothetical protein [Cyclobacteriaceae bacterium]
MNPFTVLILLPVVSGIVLFFIPEKIKKLKGFLTILVSLVTLVLVIQSLSAENGVIRLSITGTVPGLIPDLSLIKEYLVFNLDPLVKLVLVFTAIFALLISLYSVSYLSRLVGARYFYEYYLITLGSSFGALLSDHMLVFLFFWGVLGLTLYKLIRGYDDESSSAAKKTLILIGASDSLMILGAALIWLHTGTFSMSEISLPTNTVTANVAFICMLIGSFTKAGAFPFHSWIPDYVKKAPASSSAYLPASLDKLLGIYFLTRICVNLFVLNQWLVLTILIIGVTTIIAAVMMALIQHNYKKLLGYHAVSQVGYMVVGIGLGSPIGIAGGLFHMINHALYKSGLFLSAGSLEKQTGEEDLAELGGLSRNMPVTFISALVFALAISGIPPLNGFASKWMIYQAIIDFGHGMGIANRLWIVWLALAVFGSALTLASFIKFISGAFLGRINERLKEVREVNFLMWLPMVILAIICVGFGVVATSVVLPELLMPITGDFEFIGIWNSSMVSILILVSIVLGFILYLAGDIKKFRTDDSFVGGEKMLQETAHYSVLDFYKTISDFKFISFFFKRAEKKWFDIYDLSKGLVLNINGQLSKAHDGVLTTYTAWILMGLIILLILLM